MGSNKKNLAGMIANSAMMMTCLEMVVRYGVAVIVLPIALKKLEAAELAYYLYINTLIALSFLADSGFSQTIIRAAAYFRSGVTEIPERVTELSGTRGTNSPNWQGVGRLIATTSRIYLVIGLVAIFLLSTLGGVTVHNIIQQQDNHTNAWFVFFLLIFLSFLLLQASRWSSLLQGLNEVARAKRIELLTGILRLVGIGIALIAGFGVLGAVTAMLFAALVSFMLMRTMVLRLVRENGVLKIHEIHDSAMLKRLWPATWRMGVICWGAYLIYYGGTVVVSQVSDAKLIASYLLSFQLVTILYRFATSPAVVFQPQIAASISNNELKKVNQLTVKSVRYSLGMYVIGGLLLYYFASDALVLINSKSQLVSRDILLLMLIMYLLETHHSLHAGIYMATNHVPFMVPALVSGAAIVLAGFVFVRMYGIYGIVWTQLLVQASFNNWYPVRLTLRLQKMSFRQYLFSVFRPGHM